MPSTSLGRSAASRARWRPFWPFAIGWAIGIYLQAARKRRQRRRDPISAFCEGWKHA